MCEQKNLVYGREQAWQLLTEWTQSESLRKHALAVEACVAACGAAEAGRLVAVRMNADPGWHATEDGREIPIEPDNLGFMVLRPGASAATHIELRYRVGAEPRIMAAICVLAWIGAVAGLFLWRKHSDSPTTN